MSYRVLIVRGHVAVATAQVWQIFGRVSIDGSFGRKAYQGIKKCAEIMMQRNVKAAKRS